MNEVVGDLGTGRTSLGRILDFAWGGEAFTASDAMAAVGLTRATIIDAIDTLVDVSLLEELPNARDVGEYRAGRPARRFRLRNDLGVVIGIDAGDMYLTAALADLAGTELAHRRTKLGDDQTAEQRRAVILQELESLLADTGLHRSAVLSLCAGIAAPVAIDGTSPPHPEGFWERTNPGLFQAFFGWARCIEIKNDAQLAATAEGTLGAAVNCRNYIALLAGERLGAGVVVDGHLLHGAHGGVGEMFAFDFVRGVNSAFGLGPMVERLAKARLASGELRPESTLATLLPDQIDARHVLELAAEGDPEATEIAREIGKSLGRIVGVLGSMFDPECVIVCGAIATGIEPALKAARKELGSTVHLPTPHLLRSDLGADIVLKGAIATALRSAREIALPQEAAQRLAER